jgi:hypothetical protein
MRSNGLWGGILQAASALALAGGCKAREQPPAQQVARAAPTASADVATSCTLAPLALKRPAPHRLVAIGDLHGDLVAARSALRAAGAIDADDRWSGGDLVVVQTGDVLDRGDDEQAILDLLFRLEGEAAAAGGALVLLLGNHELMNAAGDFRYVTPHGMHDFDEAGGDRLAVLGPGGVYGKKLAAHNVIAIVGDTVFAHGGVLGDWVTHVDEVNQSTRCWLDGQASALPPALTADDSPVWSRAAAGEHVDCAKVRAALEALGVKRMVVGHTVQRTGITSACDGAVWRIDVGLAKAYGGPIEVLELVPDAAPRVVAGKR